MNELSQIIQKRSQRIEQGTGPHDQNNLNQETVLSVQHLSKKIGKKWIIQDISFDVRSGEIFGFLGPNGAGKTTTIRMLVDLIRPTKGVITICGHNVNRDPERALAYIGSIVENPEVYPYLTGWENLEHFARMQRGVDSDRINEVVEIVGMDQRIHDKVKTYSLGMRQRLGIAQALLGRPKLLILDEPTNGLDPKGIKELRLFIRKLAGQGMAVFVSSHLLSEIQLLCDRVAIISRGKVLTVGDVDELISGSANYVVWELSPKNAGEQILRDGGIPLITNVHSVLDDTIIAGMSEEAVVAEMVEEQVAHFIPLFVAAGVQVRGAHQINPTLEQLFLEMTEGEVIE